MKTLTNTKSDDLRELTENSYRAKPVEDQTLDEANRQSLIKIKIDKENHINQGV